MSKVRFDGYYYCLKFKEDKLDSINYILRFYPDNRVIQVSCSPNKEKNYKPKFSIFFPSGNWFNEEYEDNGNFNISGNQINFICGKIEYKGTILNDETLELFSHSNINGYESTNKYKFISFDVLNDIKAFQE